MSYASKQSFGTQRASAGRVVLIAVKREIGDPDKGPWVRAGVIIGISSRTDKPYVRDLGAKDHTWEHLVYFEAKTEEDVTKMPVGSWCWPPRL